jgi:hypothetical protein
MMCFIFRLWAGTFTRVVTKLQMNDMSKGVYVAFVLTRSGLLSLL